jgi:molybdate transport system substrate-binding protein
MRLVRALALLVFTMTGSAAAATINLYAAGSLQNALTDVAKTYQSVTGNTVSAKYGPSGLLKSEISEGAKADVFASANMEHPA